MELIDKDALVAEIKKRRKEAESNCGGYKSYDEHRCDSCTVGFYNEFQEIIDTLEVKEVDLDMNTDKLLSMLLEAIDYSFLQTDGSYDKALTYPVIDKIKYIKEQISYDNRTKGKSL